MNIPARYCTGYLGDIGVPVDPAPMDFSAWYEVFLDGRWYTLDARHNIPGSDALRSQRGVTLRMWLFRLHSAPPNCRLSKL
jgi:transglutaminase-like putative cysteine protease